MCNLGKAKLEKKLALNGVGEEKKKSRDRWRFASCQAVGLALAHSSVYEASI